jgi:hypothetical protein
VIIAAGAYLAALRSGKQWSRVKAVHAIEQQYPITLGVTTLKHIEDGDGNPGGATLAMINDVFGGTALDLDSLLRMPDAPAAYGAALAAARLAVRAHDADAPALALLLATYEDAIAAHDRASQRHALATLADHFRDRASSSPDQ